MHTPLRDAAGAAVYNRFSLAVYDRFVLEFCNRYVWRCPSQHILNLYNQHVATKHLDVGVRTGYFLDHCRFLATPDITLADLNPSSLAVAAKRISRYRLTPRVVNVIVNVLAPLELGDTFGSVGVSYLLHCLPGTMQDKRSVFERLKLLLNSDGVVFGATILGEAVTHNAVGKTLMRVYNRTGIFTNERDSLGALEQNLKGVFGDCKLELRGRVALFSAHI